MQILIAYFPLILLFAIYAIAIILNSAYIKLSGKILRGSFVSWKHALIFSVVVAIITLTGKKIGLIEGISIPAIFAIPLSFALNLVFGGWYLSTRSFTKQGQQLGWIGSMQISSLAFIFYVLTGIIVNSVFKIIAMAA